MASSFKVEEICWYPFFKFLLVIFTGFFSGGIPFRLAKLKRVGGKSALEDPLLENLNLRSG